MMMSEIHKGGQRRKLSLGQLAEQGHAQLTLPVSCTQRTLCNGCHLWYEMYNCAMDVWCIMNTSQCGVWGHIKCEQVSETFPQLTLSLVLLRNTKHQTHTALGKNGLRMMMGTFFSSLSESVNHSFRQVLTILFVFLFMMKVKKFRYRRDILGAKMWSLLAISCHLLPSLAISYYLFWSWQSQPWSSKQELPWIISVWIL